MAKYPGITMTNAGINMMTQSQGDGQLIFTSIKLGDGSLADGENIKALTTVKNPMLTATISTIDMKTAGQVTLTAIISNAAVNTAFFSREIGIYAKIGSDGIEQLYAYSNAGNYADYMPDKSTQIDENQIKITLVVGAATNVTAIINSSIVYPTQQAMQENITVAVSAHDNNSAAHGALMTAHNSDENAHSALITILKTQIENSGLNILKRDKTYIVGDIAYSANLPSWARLECIVGGKTALVEPTWGTTAGVLVTDGAVTWIIDDVRDGLSVGSLDYSHILKTGRIKANGALISRATYPRLYKYVTDNSLATTEALWTSGHSGLFSVGDGSTTFRVPDLRGRFLEGADTAAGAAIAAGLPNITGRYADQGFDTAASGTGAMYNAGGLINGTHHGNIQSGYTSVGFDASRSNAIYGASTTVQPPAITMIPQIKY